MRVDLNDSDGVIAATCNIPDSLWTSTVKAAADAAAASRGFTVDASDPDDTIDPHVQTISDQTSLVNWILANAYTAGATAPASSSSSSSSAPATTPAAADDSATVGVVAALAVVAVGGLAWLLSSGSLAARAPGRGDRVARRHRAFSPAAAVAAAPVGARWRVVTRSGDTVGEVEKLPDGSWRIHPSRGSPLGRQRSEERLSEAATALHRRGV